MCGDGTLRGCGTSPSAGRRTVRGRSVRHLLPVSRVRPRVRSPAGATHRLARRRLANGRAPGRSSVLPEPSAPEAIAGAGRAAQEAADDRKRESEAPARRPTPPPHNCAHRLPPPALCIPLPPPPGGFSSACTANGRPPPARSSGSCAGRTSRAPDCRPCAGTWTSGRARWERSRGDRARATDSTTSSLCVSIRLLAFVPGRLDGSPCGRTGGGRRVPRPDPARGSRRGGRQGPRKISGDKPDKPGVHSLRAAPHRQIACAVNMT